MKKKYSLFLAIFISFNFLACKKYLEVKPDKSLQIPVTLEDCQALLAESTTMNGSYISEGEVAADNYSINFQSWNTLSVWDREGYIWKTDADVNYGRWNSGYKRILTSNQVLETLSKIKPSANEQSLWNQLKGTALFFRGFEFYDLAQIWAKPYDAVTASNDPGIPIRLTPSLDENTERGTVQQTYDRIIQDLKDASDLLPAKSPSSITEKLTKLTKSAALAALARTYLIMGDYNNAKKNADACLQLSNVLIDYNQLNSSATYPIPQFNGEVIFEASSGFSLPLYFGKISAQFYNSYHANDLRRKFFFKDNGDQTFDFIGSYEGTIGAIMFVGLATDEMYLIRAECYARLGDKEAALGDLNALLKKRWDASFVPFTASTSVEALDLILEERRKELIFRGVRWTDLRRLNKESRYALTLKRDLNGQIYELLPNDLRYVLLIPKKVLERVSIPQNIR